MQEAKLPAIVQRGLQSLLAQRDGFARLLNGHGSGQSNPQGLLLPVGSQESVKKVLTDHGVELDSNLVAALELLTAPRQYVMLSQGSLNSTNPEQYLFGPTITTNPVIRAVFQALAFGELEFCRMDLPQQSHEERLTGHLLSKMHSALRFCAASIEEYATYLYGEAVAIEFAYHDLSTNNREKETGADFGITLHQRLPGANESVTAASFQAKKLYRDNAYLPREQAEAQLSFASEEGAFCCFYDVGAKNALPPAVFATESIAATMPLTSKSGHRIEREPLKRFATPLSVFLMLMLDINAADSPGVDCKSLRGAKRFMLSGVERDRPRGNIKPYAGPSRVLTISIGGSGVGFQSENPSLQDLFPVEFTRHGSEG